MHAVRQRASRLTRRAAAAGALLLGLVADGGQVASADCTNCLNSCTGDTGDLELSASVGSVAYVGDTASFHGIATASGQAIVNAWAAPPVSACVPVSQYDTTVNHIGLMVDMSTAWTSGTDYRAGYCFGLNPDGSTGFFQVLSTDGGNSTGPINYGFSAAGTYTFRPYVGINCTATQCACGSPFSCPWLYVAPITIQALARADYYPPDLGPAPCNARVGEPVTVTTGNVVVEHGDYGVSGGPRVTRTYNSRGARGIALNYWDSTPRGVFGKGWSTEYEESVTSLSPHLVRLQFGTGAYVHFGQSLSAASTDPFLPVAPVTTQAQLMRTTGGWQLQCNRTEMGAVRDPSAGGAVGG